jgi:glycosyltransferase involved in cell wall biosynthesis
MIASVLNQSELPLVWVIIDGGSTDKSRDIVKGYARKYPWIISQCQTRFSDKGGHTNVSLAMKEAYDLIRASGIPFDYVANIDADQVLEPNVCEGIIAEMKKNPSVGAASGQVYDPNGKPDTYPEGEISNKRIYNRGAFERVGCFPITKYSFDSVILAKLRIAKWDIKTHPEYKIHNLRKDMGIEHTSKLKSNLQWGRSKYYLGYSFSLLVMGCGYLVLKGEFGKSIGVFFGYLGSWINRDEVISDKEVWNHFHNDRLNEILGGIWISPKHIILTGIMVGVFITSLLIWRFML